MVIARQPAFAAGLTRRNVLAAAASAAAAGSLCGLPSFAASLRRVAVIDWAMAESALALGHPPVAMAELIAFRREAPEALPDTIADIGLRGTPNLEALSLAAPDLILSTNYYAFVEPQLARIAPVFVRTLYQPGEAPLPRLMALLPELAEAIGEPGAAAPVLAAAKDEFRALAVRAAAHAQHPCLLMEIGDPRHVRIFGDDSLFGSTLAAIGLANAWTEGTRFAFNAPVPMERLAEFPDARFILTGDVPPQAARALERGALWNSLAPVRAGRVHQMPVINAFGGLPSGLRFAREIVAALEAAG